MLLEFFSVWSSSPPPTFQCKRDGRQLSAHPQRTVKLVWTRIQKIYGFGKKRILICLAMLTIVKLIKHKILDIFLFWPAHHKRPAESLYTAAREHQGSAFFNRNHLQPIKEGQSLRILCTSRSYCLFLLVVTCWPTSC